jgi:hypothetical protein
MQNRIGLSHVLTGNLSLEESIQTTPVSGLFLLSGGIRPPNPSDLLGSRKMREILKSLRESFNFILMDSPPAIAVSDAAVLSMVSDGIILVFHGQKTTTASARQVVERLDAIRAPILGVILNGIDVRNPSYAYYRHYYGSNYDEPELRQPNNGSETTIETSSTEMPKEDVLPNESAPGPDLSEEEIPTGKPGSGTVPRAFFDQMTAELRQAVGPMAPVIVWDHIRLLGESRDGFPRSRFKELVENVCKEVLNDKLRQGFRTAMDQGLRSL